MEGEQVDHLQREAHVQRLHKWGAHQFAGRLSASQYFAAYDLVQRFVRTDARALDWGTGEGHFSAFLLSQGMQTTGLTLDAECLLSQHLQDAYGERYTLVRDASAVRTLPFSDGHFDLVTSIGVLEHVRETGGDEAASLREIVRVLRPGGIFLCYHFPNRYSWIEAITRNLSNKHNHPYKYSRKDLLGLLHDAGLEVLETRRYGFLPRLLTMRLPSALRDSRRFSAFYEASDRFLSTALSLICQNHYAVARKPG